MRLGEILEGAMHRYARGATDDLSVTDVAYDSRHIVPGSLFACVPGTVNDGHDFALDALRRGATALLVERELDLMAPQVIVPDARDALALVSANLFGNASRRLQVVGVTGTAGKTTVTMLVEHMLNEVGMACGLVGTVCYRMGERTFPHLYTTPESRDLQELLGLMAGMGARAVSMEVSSHALLTHRCAHTRFAVAAFTNLSVEHMDLHGTMEDYFATKVRLFTEADVAARVVCTTSRWGLRLARLLRDAGHDVVEVSEGPAADVCLLELKPWDQTEAIPSSVGGNLVRAKMFGRELCFGLPMPGDFNAWNALVALAIVHELGLDPAAAAATLATFPGVPGRMERIDAGSLGLSVVVDFAHTPAELGCALRAAREVATGRVAVVFGCGGDRDQDKRPLMGEAATQADLIVVTSDNPRSEDPADIAGQAVSGMGPDAGRAHIELDRRMAIRYAVRWARPGDVVLVAGKGHESTQVIGDRVNPFDDREVVREELRRRIEGFAQA